jgi:tetratricopeptide (TPR) repeat protein
MLQEDEIIDTYRNYFIKFSIEEVERIRKTKANIPVTFLQNKYENVLDITSKLPLIRDISNVFYFGYSIFSYNLERKKIDNIVQTYAGLTEERLASIFSEEALHYATSNIEKLKALENIEALMAIAHTEQVAFFNNLPETQARKKTRIEHNIKYLTIFPKPKNMNFYNLPSTIKVYFPLIETNIIDEAIKKNNFIVLSGMGGVGKTTAAIAYANEHKDEYESRIRLIKCSSLEIFNLSIKELAEDLEIEVDNLTQDKILEKVINYLRRKIDRSLLIFDECSDFALLTEFSNLVDHKMIITLQNEAILKEAENYINFKIIKLEPIQSELAVSFIDNLLGINKETQELKAKLAELFAYFPLGISHAINYIKKNSLSIDNYLQKHSLKKQNKSFLDFMESSSAIYDIHKANLFVTLSLSIETMSSEAKEILKILAVLEPHNIPTTILNKISNDGNFLKIIDELLGYSFIKFDQFKGFASLHVLIHIICQEKFEVNIVSSLTKASSIISDAMEKNTAEENFDNNRILINHAENIIQKYQPLMSIAAKSDPENDPDLHKKIILLLNECGKAYFNFGDKEKALEYFDRGLKLLNKFQPENISKKLALMENKADVLFALQIYDQASSIYNEIIAERTIPQTNNLKLKRLYAEEKANPEKDLSSELQVLRQTYKENNGDKELLLVNLDLACYYQNNNNIEESEKLYDEAIQILERFTEQDEKLFYLGKVYRKKGNFEKALEYFRAAQQQISKVDNPIYYGLICCYMAEQHDKLSDSANSKKFYNYALEILKEKLGSEHFFVKDVKNIIKYKFETGQPIARQISGSERELELSLNCKKIPDSSQSEGSYYDSQILSIIDIIYDNNRMNNPNFYKLVAAAYSLKLEPNIIFNLTQKHFQWLVELMDDFNAYEALEKYVDVLDKYEFLLQEASLLVDNEKFEKLISLKEDFEAIEQLVKFYLNHNIEETLIFIFGEVEINNLGIMDQIIQIYKSLEEKLFSSNFKLVLTGKFGNIYYGGSGGDEPDDYSVFGSNGGVQLDNNLANNSNPIPLPVFNTSDHLE